MDPLGASAPVVDVNKLTPWSVTPIPEYDFFVENPNNMRKSPFPHYNHLNEKIVLWSGDLTALNVDAIVNSTDESMSAKYPVSEHIMNKAGPQLKFEIKNSLKTCKTGEAKLTEGYSLPARYIIHTVGPRYNIKYKTAAESALFSCYRNTLILLRENNLSTLGLQCIHSSRRGYPNYEGAHIAIRAVRRFLEKLHDDIEKIVFVVTGDNEDVYRALMPLYFPRSQKEEDFAAYHLPYDIGNEDGEPVIEERQIRITGKPNVHSIPHSPTDHSDFSEGLEESININEAFDMSVAVGAHSFAKMEGDIDKKRRQKLQGKITVQSDFAEQQKRYERWLRRGKREDLTEIEQLRCLYHSGFDKCGRAVIVFVGKFFKADRINLEKAVMYLIQTMDAIVERPFVLVYLHTATNKVNQPDLAFIKDVYNLLDYRYKKNLKALYVIHPTFWSKLVTWFFTTFSYSEMKDKVINLPGLEYLYARITPDQLDLPNFVIEYDMKEYGTRYYNPEEDQSYGAL